MKTLSVLLSVLLLFVSGCKHNLSSNSPKRIRISEVDADAAEPAIASSADGNVYVAWVNHAQEGKADVMMARFNGDGQMQSTPVRVNTEPGIATAWRGDPPTIAVAPNKTIVIGWTMKVQSESGHATDLFVSVSRDQGRTFNDAVKVNDDERPTEHGMHSLTIGKDGCIYVAWLDERNITPMASTDMKMKQGTSGHHMESNREVFIASSSDNGRTFSSNKRIATNVCPCCKTALATDSNGRLYLSWRQVLPGNFRHIAVSSSIDHGQTFNEPKIVSDDQWMLAGCPVSGSTMSVSVDGTLHVLWYSAGKNGATGLYSSESQDGGNSFGPRTLIAAGEVHGTPVLINDGEGLAAVWETTGGKIMMNSLTPGSLQLTPIAIADGSLPAAVETPSNRVTAYISKDEQSQAIFITSAARSELNDQSQ